MGFSRPLFVFSVLKPNILIVGSATESIRLTSKGLFPKINFCKLIRLCKRSEHKFVSQYELCTSSHHNTDLVMWSGCVVLCHKSPISDRIQLRGARDEGGEVSYFIKRERSKKGAFHLYGHSRLRFRMQLSYFIKRESWCCARAPFFWTMGGVHTKKSEFPIRKPTPTMKDRQRLCSRIVEVLFHSLDARTFSLRPLCKMTDRQDVIVIPPSALVADVLDSFETFLGLVYFKGSVHKTDLVSFRVLANCLD